MKKSNEIFKSVGIVANAEKRHCRASIQKAIEWLAERGTNVILDVGAAELLDFRGRQNPVHEIPELAAKSDLLLVFGGDGTILRVARESAASNAPLLGVNTGRLGFLAAASSKDVPHSLQKVWNKEFHVETRPLIQASVSDIAQKTAWCALNEFVIGRGDVSRMIELEVSVDGEPLTRYRGDGLIVSSPTGSTAYSLAAGGAIVSPKARVFALTPICPHALSNRSVIVNLDSVIQVTVLTTRHSTIFSADGQKQEILNPGSCVKIRRSKQSVRLMRLEGTSFFETLRQKLQWRGTSV